MHLFTLPTKKVRAYFLTIMVIYACIQIAPYLYAYATTPEGHYCTGLIGYPDTEVCDQNFYIAWGPAQVAIGHTLLEDKLNGYTNQRLVFNFWWWLTGNVQRIADVDIYLLNHIQRFVASLVLCLVVFNLLGQFLKDRVQQVMAFLLVLFSGYNLHAYPEGNVFESMLWEVVLPAGHIFFFVAIYYCHRATFVNRSELWKAGVASLVMSTVYPYATVSVSFIMFNCYAFLAFTGRVKIATALKDFTFLVVCMLPIVAYDYYIISTDSRYIEGIATFTSEAPYLFIPGYGLLIILAIAGAYFTWVNRISHNYFLVIWMLSTFIQIYFPIDIIPFQIQLILGIQFPMAVLAIYGFIQLVEMYLQSKVQGGVKWGLFIAILISVSATNARMYYRIIKKINTKEMPIYLHREIVEGMHWLKSNSNEEEVVISTPIISSYIPVLAGNRIFSSDYWAPTPDFPEKVKKIDWLFNDTITKTDDEIVSFMHNNRISYVFENNYYQKKNLPLSTSRFQQYSALKKVFRNDFLCIYALNQRLVD